MNEFFIAWLLLASIQLAATISPGPAFAMTVRNSIAHNRKAGIFTALGLGIGVGIHMIAVIAGISLLLVRYPLAFTIIKYAGAAYLVYLGAKGLISKKRKTETIDKNIKPDNPDRKIISFLTQGILTNILNPKAWVWFPVVLTQFIHPDMSLETLILYGITPAIIEAGWFACLTIFLTNPKIQKTFLSFSHWIERLCGVFLIGLGIKLILDKGLKITP